MQTKMNDESKLDLYSRQLYALGKESLHNMSMAKILIIGHQTPFVEIVKNLILMGINQITLYDESLIDSTDIDGNYYINNNDIGKKFSDVVGFRMSKLNPNVKINKFTSNLSDLFLNSFNLIVILNSDKNLSLRLHKLGIAHILTVTNEFRGFIFVDLIKFTSMNPNGEKIKSGLILSTNDNIITTVDRHDLFVGNKIKIHENNEEVYNVIKIIDTKTFKINIQLNTNNNVMNDSALIKYEEIKIPKEFTFKSINEFVIPSFVESKIKNGYVFINSIVGGIVTQNIINFINKVGTPINQTLSYDYSQLEILIDNGKFNHKVINKNVFIVGAGALGCEHIKNLAYLGVKNIIITDYDQIEKSNLSRQFLFRNNDIKKFKSQRAKRAINKMKPEINVTALKHKVCKDTENIFTSKFYKNLDCIFNALDTIEARKYVDSKCIDYDLPLFEAGTLGTKANTQTIIPYLTETYSDSTNEDFENIPLCTIKNFPYKPEHCVAWAKEIFAELFSSNIDSVNELDLEQFYKEKIIENITELINKYPENYTEDGVKFWSGIKKFPNLNNINQQLISDFFVVGDSIKNRIIQNNMLEDFDKDAHHLNHVKFIEILTNIRSSIYSIELIDEFTTKGIAGKIIPALCTTTSVASGLLIVEFLKYCMNDESTNGNSNWNWNGNGNVNNYANNYINLSLNLNISSTPILASKNLWTKINLSDISIEDILIKIHNDFDDYIQLIEVNNQFIYNSDIEYELNFMNKKIRDIIKTNDIIFGSIILDNDNLDLIKFYIN